LGRGRSRRAIYEYMEEKHIRIDLGRRSEGQTEGGDGGLLSGRARDGILLLEMGRTGLINEGRKRRLIRLGIGHIKPHAIVVFALIRGFCVGPPGASLRPSYRP